LNKISGTTSFGAAARITYVFGVNPNNTVVEDVDERFIMAESKNNLEKEKKESQIYNIEGVEVEEDGVIIKTSKINWLGTSTINSQEIVDYMPNKGKSVGRPNDKSQDCINEIVSFVGDKESLTISETKAIKSLLLSLGFNEQMERKCREELGIKVVRVGNDPYWIVKKQQILN
jgi:hypothetical protein